MCLSVINVQYLSTIKSMNTSRTSLYFWVIYGSQEEFLMLTDTLLSTSVCLQLHHHYHLLNVYELIINTKYGWLN